MVRTGTFAAILMALVAGGAEAREKECKGIADFLAGKMCCATLYSAGWTRTRACRHQTWSSRAESADHFDRVLSAGFSLVADAPIACMDAVGDPIPARFSLDCKAGLTGRGKKHVSVLFNPGNCLIAPWVGGEAVLRFDDAPQLRFRLEKDRGWLKLSGAAGSEGILERMARARGLVVDLTPPERAGKAARATFDLSDGVAMAGFFRKHCAP